jgi:DNA (cytosine-5)-methyltransferase 1
MLTHFSVFSGIGGLDLAAEWAGFNTVGQVEKAEFPYQVLSKHWPNVPKWRDIRDVTDDAIRNAGIGHITVLSGGFPCQPFSNGGKRRGKADDRFLWPEMLRVIKIAGPDWIIGENVAGIIDMELDNVLSSLEDTGYSCRAFCVPACGVGAPHRRDRVFIIANINGFTKSIMPNEKYRVEWKEQALYEFEPDVKSCEGWERPWVDTATRLCGVDDGVSDGMDRINALGNAVVPQQAYPFFQAIADIEANMQG